MSENNSPVVGIIMGSTSDMPVMEACMAQLEEFGEGEDLHLVCVAEIAFAAALDGLIIPSRNGGSVENAHRRSPNGPAVGPDLG